LSVIIIIIIIITIDVFSRRPIFLLEISL